MKYLITILLSLGAVFAVLKFTGVVSWSWWWITPAVAVGVPVAITTGVIYLVDKERKG